jgi:hypothetical protein
VIFVPSRLSQLEGMVMKEQTHDNPRIIAAAERQMHAWAMNQEFQQQAIRAGAPRRSALHIFPFVTISREAGAGGGEVARLVGERLGWEVLDKSLLDRVADRFHDCREMLDLVDETESNWVYDVLGTWMDRQIIPHEKYVAHLSRVILSAVRRCSCVLVGRGAQFLLPRNVGIAVRLTASKQYRVEQIMRLRGLGPADARRYMLETDCGRHEFVERFFHRDINDLRLYDLVINTERIGLAGAAEQIVAAVGRNEGK